MRMGNRSDETKGLNYKILLMGKAVTAVANHGSYTMYQKSTCGHTFTS